MVVRESTFGGQGNQSPLIIHQGLVLLGFGFRVERGSGFGFQDLAKRVWGLGLRSLVVWTF